MNLPVLLLIIGVLGGFIFLIMNLPEDTPVPYDQEARQAIEMFTKSGEMIGFDKGVIAPVTTYVYKPTGNTVSEVLSNGTVIQKPELILVPEDTTAKETSSVSVNAMDSKLQQIQICKTGYPCDFTGTIVLIDPVKEAANPSAENKIPPPYNYLLTIDCNYRDYCSLNPVAVNESTFGDGTFKYTWVPTVKVTPGEYKVTMQVNSYYSNEKGERQLRVAEKFIQVVP